MHPTKIASRRRPAFAWQSSSTILRGIASGPVVGLVGDLKTETGKNSEVFATDVGLTAFFPLYLWVLLGIPFFEPCFGGGTVGLRMAKLYDTLDIWLLSSKENPSSLLKTEAQLSLPQNPPWKDMTKGPAKHDGPPIGLTSEAASDQHEVDQKIPGIWQKSMEEVEGDGCYKTHGTGSSTDLR